MKLKIYFNKATTNSFLVMRSFLAIPSFNFTFTFLLLLCFHFQQDIFPSIFKIFREATQSITGCAVWGLQFHSHQMSGLFLNFRQPLITLCQMFTE